MGFLIWLESTSLSVWMRESPSLWAFPFVLYLHTLGLALLAGLSTALAVWVLMSPGEVPPPRMRQFFPLMWLGFFINTLSGVLLLIAYPAKALTNPVFYLKLIAIGAAIVVLQRLDRELFAAPGRGARAPEPVTRQLAVSLIALWAIATVTGRFLAYTYSILLATEPGFF
jgi:hypothetical protein